MENYGRGNPYMQDLSGTYDNYFGETFDMDTGQVGLRDVVGDLKRYAEENADMIRDRQINRENPFYEDRIINMVPVPEEPTAMPPIPEDMYMDMFDDSNLGNYDLYHLMRNGYTLEEAQAILAEQGLA